MVGGDEEISEQYGSGGSVDRVVRCVFRNVYSTDLSVIVVAGTYIPDIRKVVEAMRDRLKFRQTVSTKLLIESEIVGYLSNMKCVGESIVTGLVPDQVMGGG